MSALNFISPRAQGAMGLLKHRGRRNRNLTQASVTHEDAAEGGVRVEVLTSDGQSMGEKVGFETPDGARCFVRVFGARVPAVKESGRWVYRVPKREDE